MWSNMEGCRVNVFYVSRLHELMYQPYSSDAHGPKLLRIRCALLFRRLFDDDLTLHLKMQERTRAAAKNIIYLLVIADDPTFYGVAL